MTLPLSAPPAVYLKGEDPNQQMVLDYEVDGKKHSTWVAVTDVDLLQPYVVLQKVGVLFRTAWNRRKGED